MEFFKEHFYQKKKKEKKSQPLNLRVLKNMNFEGKLPGSESRFQYYIKHSALNHVSEPLWASSSLDIKGSELDCRVQIQICTY